MSGYLDVKYPSKTNYSLNPFKTWKKQWCILRPSPTCEGGASLAIYSSEAGSVAGNIQIPQNSSVRKTKSRTRAHAFAIFSTKDKKPLILLASLTENDTGVWIDKIKNALSGKSYTGPSILQKDSYPVSVMKTDISIKYNLGANSQLSFDANKFTVKDLTNEQEVHFEWKWVVDVGVETVFLDKYCAVHIDSKQSNTSGILKFSSPLLSDIVESMIRTKTLYANTKCKRRLSKSEGDLRGFEAHLDQLCDSDKCWNIIQSDLSLDDSIVYKESNRAPSTYLPRCNASDIGMKLAKRALNKMNEPLIDCSTDRRQSLASVASGIYEEIPDDPSKDKIDGAHSTLTHSHTPTLTSTLTHTPTLTPNVQKIDRWMFLDEPTYESVGECVYATMRRSGRRYPPPLPPRVPYTASKLSDSWSSRLDESSESSVTRHSSLGSIPRSYSISSSTKSDYKTKTLPRFEKSKQAFNAFRKRLKSESRVTTSPKTKEINETKKKKFDFPPKDIFKTLVGGKKKKTNLNKIGETKSCEFLDETEHVTDKRSSKSVEHLEDIDISIQSSDDVLDSLTLPQDIVDLFLKSRELVVREVPEDAYMPMSPIMAPPIEHQYMIMSPRSNVAL